VNVGELFALKGWNATATGNTGPGGKFRHWNLLQIAIRRWHLANIDCFAQMLAGEALGMPILYGKKLGESGMGTFPLASDD
jgi:hypothetical protein